METATSPDYVIWTPGSNRTWWNFKFMDFPINFFGLGHICWLAIIFNQQIPNEQNTYLTVTIRNY